MSRVLFCKRCGTGYSVLRVVPLTCPSCEQETVWTSSPLGPWPFGLSLMDKKFLKSIKVQADED